MKIENLEKANHLCNKIHNNNCNIQELERLKRANADISINGTFLDCRNQILIPDIISEKIIDMVIEGLNIVKNDLEKQVKEL